MRSRVLLLETLLHMMKIAGWPGNDAAEHWRNEIVTFLAKAARRYTKSMRQLIDLEDIYHDALLATQRLRIQSVPPATLRAAMPVHAGRAAGRRS